MTIYYNPEYWLGLVDADTITVSITPRGRRQEIYVGEIKDNQVEVMQNFMAIRGRYSI
jgi:hypothetical protein